MDTSSKKIGITTATIVGMNAMIGAGIFSVPAALGSSVGPAGLITYAFVVLAVWFMGSAMARLAQLYPEEGSFYTYASQWGGHTAGVVATGSYLLGLVIAMGLLVKITGYYLHVTFAQVPSFWLGLITLILLVILNSIGVTLSKLGQMILICCTVAPILLTIVMCLFNGSIHNFFPFMPYGIKSVFTATKAVIFGFFGFECAASLFSIVENPQKNVPRALMYAIALVGILYILFVGAIIFAVPLYYFTDPTMPVSQILQNIFPHHPWLLGVIHFSILSALLGTLHSMIWSASSLVVAFAKKLHNHTVKKLCTNKIINQRSAVFFIGLCIFSTFSTLQSIDLFFSLTAVFLVFSFMLSMITLLTLPNETSLQKAKTVLGFFTGCIIFYFALQGILTELHFL